MIKNILNVLLFVLLLNGCSTYTIGRIYEIPCWINGTSCISSKYKLPAVGSCKIKDHNENEAKKCAIKNAKEVLAQHLKTHVEIIEVEKSTDIVDNNSQRYKSKTDIVSTLTTNTDLLFIETVKTFIEKKKNKYFVLIAKEEDLLNQIQKLQEVKSLIKIIKDNLFLSSKEKLKYTQRCLDTVSKKVKEVVFKTLHLHQIIKENENYYYYSNIIEQLKDSLESNKRYNDIINNLTIKERRGLFDKEQTNFAKDVKNTCSKIQNNLNINIKDIEGYCKLYLGQKKLCRSYCGDNKSIYLKNDISIKKLYTLNDIDEISEYIYPLIKTKYKITVLKNTIEE